MNPPAPADGAVAAAATRTEPDRARRLVFRNAGFLLAAQIVAAPLSVLLNAAAARGLGPAGFGTMYLATTFASFAMLFVEWGQGGILMARVAGDRSQAGELLGSSLAWRAAASVLALLAMPACCWLLGYDRSFLPVVVLATAAAACVTLSTACQDVLRGYERTDFGAATYVGSQVLAVAILIPTLLLGGKLRAFMLAQAAAAAVGVLFVLACLAPLGIPRLHIRWMSVKALFAAGGPFLLFNLVMALQPGVDALLLSKFAPADPIGWYATARKLVGVLVFPCSALVAALYPTLCRLQAGDPAECRRTTAAVLRWTVIGSVPIALGCALFPAVGIAIFGGKAYEPAADDLRILALYVLLVYWTMPLGSSLTAAGRLRAWTLVQCGCVVVSAVLDPLLIPWFQHRTGNGGMGVCVAAVASEIMVLAAALRLLPAGTLDHSLWRTLAAVSAAGMAMVLAAAVTSRFGPLISVPAALAAYAACALLLGEFSRTRLAALRSLLRP